jgi:hypothetical protein
MIFYPPAYSAPSDMVFLQPQRNTGGRRNI